MNTTKMNEGQELQLQKQTEAGLAKPMPSAIEILQGAISGGITPENVAVVKELRQMVKDERDEQSKREFNRSFFRLRQEISSLDLCADKAASTSGGKIAFTYCSETELSKMLEPVLFKHGFAMMCGQEIIDGRVTIKVTLMHESGHSEDRDFTVRAGAPNAMKDAASCDAGAATTAWRHLMIKMFGLKSRIREQDDPRLMGGIIGKEKAAELQHRLKMVNGNEKAFLRLAGVETNAPCLEDYEKILSGKLPVIEDQLERKERSGR